jgi:hypothetical protein
MTTSVKKQKNACGPLCSAAELVMQEQPTTNINNGKENGGYNSPLTCELIFGQRDCRVQIILEKSFQSEQGCQIFRGPNTPKWEQFTKWPQTIPNGHKLNQMSIKCSKLS